MSELELQIEALAVGGNGIGRYEGKAIFVPLTAPGDRVRCRMVQQKKRYGVAELIEVLQPSEMRREPPCPHFGACGGCQWQHLEETRQGELKETLFRDLLERQSGVGPALVGRLVAAPSGWGYRSRAQIKCRQTPQGFVMGFYRRGSHYVVDMTSCPVLDERLNAAWRRLRPWLEECCDPGAIPQLDLGVGDDDSVRAVVHYVGKRADELSKELSSAARSCGIALFLQQGRKSSLKKLQGPADLHLQIGGLDLAYGPGGFSQINQIQNRTMVSLVVEALRGRGSRVLDLYCGMGNFSLPLAEAVSEVVGVEDYSPSIASARQNARRNSIGNAFFYAESAVGALRRHGDAPFDAVVLDPPRSGAFEVVKDLLASPPPQVLYISCDPATLARDLKPLLHNGYDLLWSRPVDMFPQTAHIESITLLQRH